MSDLHKTPPPAARAATPNSSARLGPEKVSVARLPITGSDIFGREEDMAFLDAAWANQDVNVVRMYVINGLVSKSSRSLQRRPLLVQFYT
jgi:hypothetical protein